MAYPKSQVTVTQQFEGNIYGFITNSPALFDICANAEQSLFECEQVNDCQLDKKQIITDLIPAIERAWQDYPLAVVAQVVDNAFGQFIDAPADGLDFHYPAVADLSHIDEFKTMSSKSVFSSDGRDRLSY